MVLLIKTGGPAVFPEWKAAFEEFAPSLEVRAWDDRLVSPEDVQYVLVWEPDAGRIATFPNLRLILSASAGVDHILADPELPTSLRIVRMVMHETAERMADFVIFASLGLIRHLPELSAARCDRSWQQSLTGRLASDTTVGIMGLGQLGAYTAIRLSAVGFNVAGWSRRAKSIAGVECLAGDGEFSAFLSKCDILVNLLPDTVETRGILNASSLSKLPAGAGIVNVGRGRHLDVDALRQALDSGALSGAVLDVFEVEPLPKDDPLWLHPKIFVSPHIASTVSRRARARQAAAVIAADLAGKAVENLFDRNRGY